MNESDYTQQVERTLDAWNSQDVDAVLDCYTAGVAYTDPSTRGPIEGAEAFRSYLTKLFDRWQMTWSAREVFPIEGIDGAAFLWHATLRPKDGDREVEVDGMDLVVMEGDRIARNEVYFDRAALASLLEPSPSAR